MSPEHPHPAGRRHAQHPPLPQHGGHAHVTKPYYLEKWGESLQLWKHVFNSIKLFVPDTVAKKENEL